MSNKDSIIKDATYYYTKKLNRFGPTFQGVDWNSKESQELRFGQLLKVIDKPDDNFSIIDYGCGYGALYLFMKNKFSEFDFYGYDASKSMIEKAISLNSNAECSWFSDPINLSKTDYVVASGLFNVKQSYNADEWNRYVIDTLVSFNTLAVKGFSFNLLTKYSDKVRMKNNLFYADPLYFFDYCKMNFSKNIALLHDYSLYEFTILVRKGK